MQNSGLLQRVKYGERFHVIVEICIMSESLYLKARLLEGCAGFIEGVESHELLSRVSSPQWEREIGHSTGVTILGKVKIFHAYTLASLRLYHPTHYIHDVM